MKTTIYNKVMRMAALLFVGSMMTTSVVAQECLHLFYKNGTHERFEITKDLQVEFVKHPYLEETGYTLYGDTIYISASSGRTMDFGYVESNVSWEIEDNADWLTTRAPHHPKNQRLLGDGMVLTYILIFTEANKTNEPRTAKLTIKPERGESKVITVVQNPFVLSLAPVGGHYGLEPITSKECVIEWSDTLFYDAYTFPGFDTEVKSYPDWMHLDTLVNTNDKFSLDQVAQVPDSITVTGENISSGQTYAIFSFTPNTTAEDRTGEIVFEGRGQTATIIVTQKGVTEATSLASLEEMQQWMVQSSIMSSSDDDFSHMSVLHATDMMAGDMTMLYANSTHFLYDYGHSNNAITYRRNAINWETYYELVYLANSSIGLMTGIEDQVPNGEFVLGNAYAYRAMAYLYLIQLFQDPTTESGVDKSLPGVPLLYAESEKAVMTTEQIEYFKGRNTVGEVFAQIEADIIRAIALLQGKERPSKNFIDASVAQGIAARYYLLAQDWDNAAAMASAARNGYCLMDGNTETNGIRDGFMDIANEEWMWGFDHTSDTQTMYASFFSHISNFTPGYSGLGYTGRGVDAGLLSQMSATDYRRAYWYRDGMEHTESTAEAADNASMWQYPYALLKFGWNGDWTMDYLYMRAAEMVLIEAEALSHMGETDNATASLAELMSLRDPEWNVEQVTLEDIYLQRRLELIGEGHVYFDLKRLNRGIVRSYEGNNHPKGYVIDVETSDPSWVYKIPQRAIDNYYLYNLSEEDNNP